MTTSTDSGWPPPRREAKRFEVRFPVIVHVSIGPNHKMKVQGALYDIGVNVVRLVLEQPVPPSIKSNFFVHFRAPEKTSYDDML